MKTLGTEMLAVTSQFDKNDKSSEALTAQNEVLNKQIDLQKQKLSQLQSGLAAASTRYGEADKVTQGWQQTVNKATADLNKMERRLSENISTLSKTDNATDEAAGSIDKLGNAMSDAEKKADVFGGVLGGTLVGSGLAKVSESAIEAAKSVADFAMGSDASIGSLQAKLGLTKEAAADLSAIAEAVWADGFGEDLTEATNAVAVIRQSLGEMAEDDLYKVSESALTVKQVFGAEVNESIRTVKTMMDNFGISAEQAFDLVTVGYQNGLDYSGEFLDTLNEYSPQFKGMGISAQDAMNMLIQGSQNGAFSLDKVADAMKEFNIRIKDGSDTTREGLQMIGLDYDSLIQQINSGSLSTGDAMQLIIGKLNEQDDTVNQNMAGVNLFGTQWEDLGASAVLAMGGISDSLNGVDGATKRAGEAANANLQAQFEKSIRGIQEALAPLAESVLSFANNNMPQMKNGLQWVVDNAGNIAAGITSIVVAAAGLKILGTINTLIDAAKKSWQAYKLAVEGATIAQWAFDAAWAATGIPLIIIAVAALVAGLVVLWNTNEGFRNAVIGVWTAVKDFLINAWTTIKDTAVSVWNGISAFFSEWGLTILGIITGPAGWIALLITYLVQNWDTIKQTISGALEAIVQFFNDLPGKIGYALGYALGTIIQFGIDTVTFFAELPEKIAQWLLAAFTKIGEWGTNLITWASTEIPKFIESVVNFYAELPGKIWDWLSAAYVKIGEWKDNLIAWARTEIPKIVINIVTFFSELPGKMVDIGINLIKGLWQGIKDTIGWLEDMVGDFIDNFIQGIKDGLGIESPSKVMAGIGKNISLGLAQGITEAAGSVEKAVSGVMGSMKTEVAFAGAGGTTNYNNGGNTIHITVQDSADLVRFLSRRGIRI